MDTIIPLLKEFGFPIALCAVLLWAIRAQNAQLVKAYTDRISTLERIVKSLTDKVDELERDRIRRSDEYGHTLKGIALCWSTHSKETNEVLRGSLKVLRELCECMRDFRPHDHRPPSPSDVPADPAKRETHPISRREA